MKVKSRHCIFRMAEEESPCVHCKRPTKGRTVYGVAVCYTCYHNVGGYCGTDCGTSYIESAERT